MVELHRCFKQKSLQSSRVLHFGHVFFQCVRTNERGTCVEEAYLFDGGKKTVVENRSPSCSSNNEKTFSTSRLARDNCDRTVVLVAMEPHDHAFLALVSHGFVRKWARYPQPTATLVGKQCGCFDGSNGKIYGGKS